MVRHNASFVPHCIITKLFYESFYFFSYLPKIVICRANKNSWPCHYLPRCNTSGRINNFAFQCIAERASLVKSWREMEISTFSTLHIESSGSILQASLLLMPRLVRLDKLPLHLPRHRLVMTEIQRIPASAGGDGFQLRRIPFEFRQRDLRLHDDLAAAQ